MFLLICFYDNTTTDEMGLWKTIELLACIFAHRKSDIDADDIRNKTIQVAGEQKSNIKRMKKERVCGAVSEISKYKVFFGYNVMYVMLGDMQIV